MQQTNAGPIAKFITIMLNQRVQAEINIVQQQLRSVKEAFGKLRDPAKERIDAMQRLPDAEKQKARGEIMQSLEQEADASLAEVLSEEQMQRFRQLMLQNEGFNAFLGNAVCDALELTDQQKANLRQTAMRNRGNTPNTVEEAQQVRDEVKTFLTDEQATKWDEMLGEPFDFGWPPRQSPGSQGPNQAPVGAAPAEAGAAPATSEPRKPVATGPAGDPFADDEDF